MSWAEQIVATALSIRGLPDDIRHATVMSLVDGLAVMAAAPALEPAVAPFFDMARAAGSGDATLISGGSATPAMAALANGAASHALDYEDTFDRAGLHPNAVAIPALLSLAEAENATFQDLLIALAVASDTTCRIGLSLPSDPALRGWYHPPMIAAAGAAIGAAHLLRLTEDQARAAVSLTLVQFSLTDALKRSPASDLRAVRDGFAARAAVDAAFLARGGVTGTTDPLGRHGLVGQLTGADPTPREDAPFLGARVSLKSWPSCRGTHPAIALALLLRAQGVSPEVLDRVVFRLRPPDDMLFEPREDRLRPESAIMAKFSIPFCFAWTLHHGAPGLAAFDEASRSDTAVLATARRISLLDCSASNTPQALVTTRSAGEESYALSMPPPLFACAATLSDLQDKLDTCAAYSHAAIPALLHTLATAPGHTPIRALMAGLRNSPPAGPAVQVQRA